MERCRPTDVSLCRVDRVRPQEFQHAGVVDDPASPKEISNGNANAWYPSEYV